MIFYEFAPTRSIRVRWILQELGVPFDPVTVNLAKGEGRRPEFLRLNPTGKLPVLVDGDFVLSESVAIVRYLAEKYPQAGFMPTDPIARAEVDRWLMFTATELEQPLWRIARNTALYPEEKRLAADVARATEDFAPMAAITEAHMKGREFVVGSSITAADFVLAYTLDWADEAGLLGGYPALQAYLARMYARPAAPMRIREAFASLEREGGIGRLVQ
jgi:glutathione S-transferase